MYVDSHCHLDLISEHQPVEEAIQNAKEAGVSVLQTISTDFTETPQLRAYAEKYPHVFFSVGVHPHEASTVAHYSVGEIKEELRDFLSHPKAIGLGETGLDFYYNNSTPEEQERSFRAHIEVSLETGIPLIIHTRDAEEKTIEILKSYDAQFRGVIHCFSGTQWLADESMKLGFDISFSGIVTFKKAPELQEVCRNVPLNRILIETDAPFLAPVPKRGRKNEPAFVAYVAEKVAELKDESLAKVAKVTTENFFRVFNKAKKHG